MGFGLGFGPIVISLVFLFGHRIVKYGLLPPIRSIIRFTPWYPKSRIGICSAHEVTCFLLGMPQFNSCNIVFLTKTLWLDVAWVDGDWVSEYSDVMTKCESRLHKEEVRFGILPYLMHSTFACLLAIIGTVAFPMGRYAPITVIATSLIIGTQNLHVSNVKE